MTGVLSGNATPFSGAAGITRSLTYNPNLSNVRGYVADNSMINIDAYSMFSPTELLSPWTATRSDPPRQAMTVAQAKHTMAIETADKQLVGTGVNKSLAFLISDDFCFKAKHNGHIEKKDQVNKLIILAYDNGEKDAIDIAPVFNKNSNGGFYTQQVFKCPYDEGEVFEKGDIIAFNPNYFSGKGKDVDYKPGALAKVAIAPGDFAYEDSTLITESLAKRGTSKVTLSEGYGFGVNTIIHKLPKIGDKVQAGDTLIEYTTSFKDEDTTEFLKNLSKTLGDSEIEDLSRDKITAPNSGTVVDLKIYYNRPLEELSDSLQEVIKDYADSIEQRRKIVQKIGTSSVHIPPVQQINSDRVGVTEFDGVLIWVGIEYID